MSANNPREINPMTLAELDSYDDVDPGNGRGIGRVHATTGARR
jgi:hypothetical protein